MRAVFCHSGEKCPQEYKQYRAQKNIENMETMLKEYEKKLERITDRKIKEAQK